MRFIYSLVWLFLNTITTIYYTTNASFVITNIQNIIPLRITKMAGSPNGKRVGVWYFVVQRSEELTMVAPVPLSIQQLDRLIQKKQITTAKKVARKPNPRNEEKDNEKNRQAQREKDRLSQSTSVGQNGKKVDLLL